MNYSQRDQLIEQFVDIVVDGMDMKSLIQYVSDDLTEFYADCSDNELKEYIDNHDEDLFDELVDNVTNDTLVDPTEYSWGKETVN